MYIDAIPNRFSPPAILLRQSLRRGKRVVKQTLANLSSWPPARVEALRRLLRGELGHLTDASPASGSKGEQALQEAGLRYISALTDPRIRRLLGEGTLQMGLFREEVCEVEADGVRYLLRKNEDEAAREQHRLEDKLAKLSRKVEQRNEQVMKSPRCQPEAGPRHLQVWVARHKLTGLVELRLEGRTLLGLERNSAAIERAMELAGCYVVVTDVPNRQLSGLEVYDSYASLQKVERDFRQTKTGLLEVRPVFVRKESRTRGHVCCCLPALKLSRELERRLQAAFGTTDADPHALTPADALAALSRLCLL